MKPTERFTDRVDDYRRTRPSYPAGLVDVLTTEVGLPDAADIADVGSGTGLLSAVLLEAGHRVFAVEPNRAMADAARSTLGDHAGFVAVDGSAEQTTLPDASVDLVVAAQAFHWFDVAAARTELRRILRPGGAAALIWNTRVTEGTPFAEAYEAMLVRWGDGYDRISRRWGDPETIGRFFAPATCARHTLDNHQILDRAGLTGRLMSSSYAPPPGDSRHEPMLAQLDVIFETHQQNGVVQVDYVTEIFCAKL